MYYNAIDLSCCFDFQCVGDDIEDLEYTPKPEFEGYFKVTNVQNEVILTTNRYIVVMKIFSQGYFVVKISALFRRFFWSCNEFGCICRLSFLDCGFPICKR